MNTFESFIYKRNFFFLPDSSKLFGVLMHNGNNIFASAYLYTSKKALTSYNVIKKYQEFDKNMEFPDNVLIRFGLNPSLEEQTYEIVTYAYCLIEGLIILTVSNFTLIRQLSCHIAES